MKNLHLILIIGLLTGISITLAGGRSKVVVSASNFERNGLRTENTVSFVNSPDLSVRYIKRLPEINYVWNSPDPAVEGWPASGSTVTWRAYVRNWSSSVVSDIKYRWLLDGTEVGSGSVSIAAGEDAYADFSAPWTFERQQLEFLIDTDHQIDEVVETNNNLLIYTDAISLNLYVEQGVYDFFHDHQISIGGDDTAIEKTNSFDDWAQIRHVNRWHRMFEEAVHPLTPDGVLDRIRIDSIVIVPDGALPLAGGLPSNRPNASDMTVDLQWGFPASLISSGFYNDTVNAVDSNPFYWEGSLLHELAHARYIIDAYGFDVADVNGDVVQIKENNEFIGGSEYLPKIAFETVYNTPHRGLMTGNYESIEEYTASAFNLIAGRRATQGNYNAPGNLGVYLHDLPEDNILVLKDTTGNVLANADVKVFNPGNHFFGLYTKIFDSIPDITGTTNTSGEIAVGQNPFQPDGNIAHPGQGILLIRVETPKATGYEFIDVAMFNLAYWTGDTLLAYHEIVFDNLVPAIVTGSYSNIHKTANASGTVRVFPYPNPSGSIFNFNVTNNPEVTGSLEIYKSNGELVSKSAAGDRKPGSEIFIWDASEMPEGIYLYRYNSGESSECGKIILSR